MSSKKSDRPNRLCGHFGVRILEFRFRVSYLRVSLYGVSGKLIRSELRSELFDSIAKCTPVLLFTGIIPILAPVILAQFDRLDRLV